MGVDNPEFDTLMLNAFDDIVGNEPFYSFVLTISAHGPYTDDSYEEVALAHINEARKAVDTVALPKSCTDEEEYIHAVAQAMETDEFIGGLVEMLRDSGKLENTVLAFYSDHYAKYMLNPEMLMEMKGAANTDMLCSTPFIIYAEGIKPMTVSKVCSAMDFAPTIANMFGFDLNYAYYTGDDVFSDGGGYVIFKGNNWYDGKEYHLAGEVSGDSYINSMNSEIQQRMEMAWDTLKSDYFVHAFR